MNEATPINNIDGDVNCGNCGVVLFCDKSGDMPEVCPGCGHTIKWEDWKQPGEELHKTEKLLDSIYDAIGLLEEAGEIINGFLDGWEDSLSGVEEMINSAIAELDKEITHDRRI